MNFHIKLNEEQEVTLEQIKSILKQKTKAGTVKLALKQFLFWRNQAQELYDENLKLKEALEFLQNLEREKRRIDMLQKDFSVAHGIDDYLNNCLSDAKEYSRHETEILTSDIFSNASLEGQAPK